MSYQYDLVVIGCGPAGEKGAARAAYHGKKCAIVERADVGGAGINTGTLPSKTLRETALYFSGLRDRGLYGIDYSLREGLTVQDFMYRKEHVVQKHWELIHRNLKRHDIDLIWGTASVKDTHTVHILSPEGDEQDVTAEVILIATGSSPNHPPEIPFDHKYICDSDSILHIERIPKTMVIVGGGVIGSEYACIFTALGVQVTLVDGRDRLLGFIDLEISDRLQSQMEALGLRFVFNARTTEISIAGDHAHVELSTGESLDTDLVLMAAGRQSNVEGLGLEALGIEMGKRGLILVNGKYQTNIPNIYAAGDVIGFPALASTSIEQARTAMVNAFDLHFKEPLSGVIPLAVYTIPEIATAGLTEEQCKEQKIPYFVGRSYYEKSPRGQIIGDMSGMLKLIFARDDKRLLGVHHIGEMSSELVHLGAQVIAAGGTVDEFVRPVYNYPTLSDSYKYAAYDGLTYWEEWMLSQTSS